MSLALGVDRRHVAGSAFALIAASFYGCVPNFARLAFNQGVPAIETVLLRTSAIAVVLAMASAISGASFHVPRAAWKSFGVQALATFIVSASYLASVQFIPVGLAVIIFFAFPVIVVVASPLVEGITPSWPRIGVAMLAFLGLGIAVGPGFNNLDLRGVFLAAAAALGCALQFFSGRSLGQYLQPAVFGSLVHLAIWPLVLAVALYAGSGQLQVTSGAASWLGLGFAGAVCLVYVGGYFFHMSSLKAAPASVVAPYFNWEPILTTIISGFLLGEKLFLNQYGGGALVLAALVLAGFIHDKKLEA
ncbi:MAG: DMT family transporter [Alphaproteobacteria bacterium]|nr:DMT family transporter [Alphaproteobacteria bacterium]